MQIFFQTSVEIKKSPIKHQRYIKKDPKANCKSPVIAIHKNRFPSIGCMSLKLIGFVVQKLIKHAEIFILRLSIVRPPLSSKIFHILFDLRLNASKSFNIAKIAEIVTLK